MCGLIVIAVSVFGTPSQIRWFHGLKLEFDEHSVVKSHSNHYQNL